MGPEILAEEARALAARLNLHAVRLRRLVHQLSPNGRAALEQTVATLEESARALLGAAESFGAAAIGNAARRYLPRPPLH